MEFHNISHAASKVMRELHETLESRPRARGQGASEAPAFGVDTGSCSCPVVATSPGKRFNTPSTQQLDDRLSMATTSATSERMELPHMQSAEPQSDEPGTAASGDQAGTARVDVSEGQPVSSIEVHQNPQPLDSDKKEVQFETIKGQDGKSLLVNGQPVSDYETDMKKVDLSRRERRQVDEELKLEIEYEYDSFTFVAYKYKFTDLYRTAELAINNGEFESKYLRDRVQQYYPNFKDEDMWCITYRMAGLQSVKFYISQTMMQVGMLRELSVYSDFNNNMFFHDIFDSVLKCKQNYYFRPQFSIFLSHSSKDKTLVSDIFTLLRNGLGYKVNYDMNFVQGASTLAQNIRIALKKSTVVLLLITPDSTESEWVKAEHAEMEGKYKLYLSYNCDWTKAEELGVDVKRYQVRRIDMYNPFELGNKIDGWLKDIDVLDI